MSHGTGLDRGYVMSKPISWLTVEAEELLKLSVSDKQWDMIVATLTHAPTDKKSAQSYNSRIKELTRMITEPITAIKRRREKDKPVVSSSWIKLEPGERAEDFI